MSKAYLLAGTAGAIIGTITAFIGVMWGVVNALFFMDLSNYMSMIMVFSTFLGPIAAFIIPYPSSSIWLLLASLIQAPMLIVTCTLTGLGFYGIRKVGGGIIGVVAFIFGIVGSIVGSLLIVVGNFLTMTSVAIIPNMYDFTLLIIPTTTPNFLIMWIGFVVLAVTFIIIGSASIKLREITLNSSASSAAGILSIIGGCLIIGGPMILGWTIIIGFILLFVAFILWAVVFFSSREM
ncbi:MAG: hypothetical protein ACUVXA_20405 [Candidatus Jordarchaeum sp.]|uniref:hypothetical protein n=1 Tax=Candidatus Jordarchaeum sp. TaxID=2823881 RepID=UPI004049E1F5